MRLDLTRLHTVSNSRPDTYSSEGFHNPQNSEMDSRIFNVAVFCCCWSLLYSAILRSRADSLRSRVILHQWLAFYSVFLNIHWSGVLTALTLLVPYETAAILARSVYTILPCTMSLHKKSHTQDACMFSCNLPPALLAEWPGSFTCYCGNTGREATTNNAWIWCSCMCIHMRTSVYSLTGRTLVKSLHRSQLRRNLRASTKKASLAHNGNPVM